MADDQGVTKVLQTARDNRAPVGCELDVSGLVVRGRLPSSLNGVLYRNGPNPQFPIADAHWFAGDGMLHAIRLNDGRAAYKNRWVRTPKWLAETRFGGAIYSSFAGKLPGAPPWAGDDSGSANTHIVAHAGGLLALEEAHPPTRIAPGSLETLGYADLAPAGGPFTAHPKIDPATGDMIFFGYNAAGPFTPDIGFGTLGPQGDLAKYARFKAPYPSMIHDFAVTDGHIVFPVLPLTGSLERARAGQPAYAWEPQKGAFLGVMPRHGGAADIRWHEGAPSYAFHVMNAWEEGDKLVVEAMVYEEPPLFPHADGSPGDPARQGARLTRWTLDLAAGGRFEQRPVDDLFGEFPRIDDRKSGLPHRHGWFAASHPSGRGGGLDGLAHRDTLTGRRAAYWLPSGDVISEPVFAPRGPDEGDGWLLAVAWRADPQVSELLVFEALDLEAGPIAVVEMPQRIPFGFHGNWLAESA